MTEFVCTGPRPAPSYGKPDGYSFGVRLPTAVVEHANEVLNNSAFGWGDTDTQDYGGIRYLHRIEVHCDDHSGGGVHYHRGVTVYQPTDTLPPAPAPSPSGPSKPDKPSPVVEVPPAPAPDGVATHTWLVGALSVAAGFLAARYLQRR